VVQVLPEHQQIHGLRGVSKELLRDEVFKWYHYMLHAYKKKFYFLLTIQFFYRPHSLVSMWSLVTHYCYKNINLSLYLCIESFAITHSFFLCFLHYCNN
jgi:hypothetical protein